MYFFFFLSIAQLYKHTLKHKPLLLQSGILSKYFRDLASYSFLNDIEVLGISVTLSLSQTGSIIEGLLAHFHSKQKTIQTKIFALAGGCLFCISSTKNIQLFSLLANKTLSFLSRSLHRLKPLPKRGEINRHCTARVYDPKWLHRGKVIS